MKKLKPFKIPVYVPQEKPVIIKRNFAQVELEKFLKKHRREIGEIQQDIRAGKYQKES